MLLLLLSRQSSKPVPVASLGGWSGEQKPKKKRLDDELETIQEAIPIDALDNASVVFFPDFDSRCLIPALNGA